MNLKGGVSVHFNVRFLFYFLSWLARSSSRSLTDLDIHIDRSIYIHTTVVLMIKALKINLLYDYFCTFIDLLTANK